MPFLKPPRISVGGFPLLESERGIYAHRTVGGVAEWFNAPVLKTDVRGSVPWVRIPPPPPFSQLYVLAHTLENKGLSAIFGVNENAVAVVSLFIALTPLG